MNQSIYYDMASSLGNLDYNYFRSKLPNVNAYNLRYSFSIATMYFSVMITYQFFTFSSFNKLLLNKMYIMHDVKLHLQLCDK